MAELTYSEFREITNRQSLEDFKNVLALLKKDEFIEIVDDPADEDKPFEAEAVQAEVAGVPAEESASATGQEGAEQEADSAPSQSAPEPAPANVPAEEPYSPSVWGTSSFPDYGAPALTALSASTPDEPASEVPEDPSAESPEEAPPA